MCCFLTAPRSSAAPRCNRVTKGAKLPGNLLASARGSRRPIPVAPSPRGRRIRDRPGASHSSISHRRSRLFATIPPCLFIISDGPRWWAPSHRLDEQVFFQSGQDDGWIRTFLRDRVWGSGFCSIVARLAFDNHWAQQQTRAMQ